MGKCHVSDTRVLKMRSAISTMAASYYDD